MTAAGICLPSPLLFIAGEWRPSHDEGTFPVFDPSSGDLIADVASATVGDVLDATTVAASAFKEWAATSPRHRAEVLRRCYELLIERQESLAALICLENGKSLADARSEVEYAAEFFRWYGEEAVRLPGTWQVAPSGRNRIAVQRQPIGVALLVTPWNFPAAMVTRKVAPALAAGCAMVLKPAAETPLTALAICDCLTEAGVLAGVVNVVPTSDPAPAVAAALAHPATRKLSFTGSTAVGRELLATAARTVTSCSMELGGNAPFLVMADADVAKAVDGAMTAKMRNGGEACTAANRIFVHDSIADEFVERFTKSMAELTIGAPLSFLPQPPDVGPLISATARRRVHSLVRDAIDCGAVLRTGGLPEDGPGYFYPPTVLDHVPPQAQILTEEIFGPVAPIVRYSELDRAIAAANDTDMGLVAYIYTCDLGAGLEVADRLEVGMVGINRAVVSDPAAPFGGVKQSGLGREGSQEGILEYTEQKYLAVDSTPGIPNEPTKASCGG